MSKQTEALKLALEALESLADYRYTARIEKTMTTIREALAEQPAQPCGYPYCECNSKAWCKLERMAENARELGLDYEPAQQKTEFVSPGGGYVPAIPRPLPIDWKLVPRKATPEMLKAMDECAQEGYDERLYAGMASSVYMAAWDASPVLGTLPPSEKEKSMMLAEQKAEQPVAWMYDVARYGPSDVRGQQWRPAISRIKPHIHDLLVRDIIPLYTSTPSPKPWVGLTQHDINVAFDDTQEGGGFDEFARAIEAKLREKNA